MKGLQNILVSLQIPTNYIQDIDPLVRNGLECILFVILIAALLVLLEGLLPFSQKKFFELFVCEYKHLKACIKRPKKEEKFLDYPAMNFVGFLLAIIVTIVAIYTICFFGYLIKLKLNMGILYRYELYVMLSILAYLYFIWSFCSVISNDGFDYDELT